MPLGTKTTQSSDEVVVTVYDDTTGTLDTHLLDMLVSWDPALLSFECSDPPSTHVDVVNGVLVFTKFNVSSDMTNGLDFRIKFSCKTSADAFVVVTNQDCSQTCEGPHWMTKKLLYTCGKC